MNYSILRYRATATAGKPRAGAMLREKLTVAIKCRPQPILADTIVVECVVAVPQGTGWPAGQRLHWRPAYAGLEQPALEI